MAKNKENIEEINLVENNDSIQQVEEFTFNDLKNNHLIQFRNGHVGTVEFFNNKPSRFMARAYNKRASSYKNDLTYNSRNLSEDYDIMKVFDGSKLDNVDRVFYAKFDVNKYPLIWERK